MLMSVIEGARSAPSYPDLAGKRVLITGLSSACGVDIARAFAEHRTRLTLQFAESGECMHAIAEIAAPLALEIKAFGPIGPQTDDAVQFARTAAQAFGGIDVVVNLVVLAPTQIDASATTDDVEAVVAARLLLPFVLSNIAANRMALTLTEGLILNIATLTECAGGSGQAFSAVIKAAMAAMTRRQAEDWQARAIRFNAIAPQIAPAGTAPVLSGEPEVAAVALYLASNRGKALSGLVFDAEPSQGLDGRSSTLAS
jgi:NAD(P)-dependent dehydrogenase (short-subunit alcohol dehydrogenase family)